ncbi:MAG: porin, partial [Pseudomonadota bacterium]|nr:porin [Pseudomonadota bacterium]
MTRLLIAAAIAAFALVTGPAAQAQSATLYGLLDASGAHVKPVGGNARWQLDNGDLQRTFIGFRGSEDLGGGLRALFKLESYI